MIRINAIHHIESEKVRKFWKREFPEYHKYDLLPVMNRISRMLVHPVIRKALIENTDEVSLRKAMDEVKVVLVYLSKGHIGTNVTNILIAMFFTSIASAAFGRVDIDEEKGIPFKVYLDEFYNFNTPSLVKCFQNCESSKWV